MKEPKDPEEKNTTRQNVDTVWYNRVGSAKWKGMRRTKTAALGPKGKTGIVRINTASC